MNEREITPEMREAIIRSVIGSMRLSGIDVPYVVASAMFDAQRGIRRAPPSDELTQKDRDNPLVS